MVGQEVTHAVGNTRLISVVHTATELWSCFGLKDGTKIIVNSPAKLMPTSVKQISTRFLHR